ncbi:MAG: hypothetical protein H5U06_06555 [Candidatus Aminicenantes bacterium]|nr:hypothetical protein [Candidatus Aminicenantes bacterium]
MKRSNLSSSGHKLAAFLLLLCFISGSSRIEGEVRTRALENNQPQDNQQAKAPAKISSFIKKELLPKLDPALANARRDLFRPSAIESISSLPLGSSAQNQIEPAEISSEEAENKSLLESLNIAYLGLVSSGSKALAVVMLDGQTVTLLEGEEVIPGVRLVKISPEEVLFKDCQGNSRKIPIKESFDENFDEKV